MDEWHELLGSKRGVQVELAISRILNVSHELRAMNYEQPVKYKYAKITACNSPHR